MYTELAKVAGMRCSDDKPFVATGKCLKSDLKRIQSHVIALLEKLDYERSFRDFRTRRLRRGRSPEVVVDDIFSTAPLADHLVVDEPVDAE